MRIARCFLGGLALSVIGLLSCTLTWLLVLDLWIR